MELYNTISRNTDPRVWFIGNNIELFNPYFLYFNIYPKEEGIKVWGDHAIQFYKNVEYEEMVNNTRFGKLIKDTPYGNYAVMNKAANVQNQFIRKRPRDTSALFNIIYQGSVYGVYAGRKCQCYVDTQRNNKMVVSFEQKDNNTNNITYKFFREMWECDYYIDSLKLNRIFYSNAKIELVGRIINRILYFM